MQPLPAILRRAYADPLSWVSLGVDLLPILAILVFGWGAIPLVALYWLENLVIGAITVMRILTIGLFRASMLGTVTFMGLFFSFHYGLFCYGHGSFIRGMSKTGGDEVDGLRGLIEWALGTAPHMVWFVGAILAVNLLFFAVDYIGKGEARRADPMTEMFAPYGRIVTLHVAIILGAALTLALGQPLMGVLILLFLRVTFGIALAILRRYRRDRRVSEGADHKTAPAPL